MRSLTPCTSEIVGDDHDDEGAPRMYGESDNWKSEEFLT